MFKEWKHARRLRREQEDQIKHHKFEEVRVNPLPRRRDIVCVILAHNEELRLPDCLRHHRELGVRRFAVVDNGSTDGTREFLLAQPDVDIFAIPSGYSEAGSGVYWRTRLFTRYGFNRWYLWIDADELLVYGGMKKHDLYALSANLRAQDAVALFAPMIDMYADRPFDQIGYRPGDRMVDACRYFDRDSYDVSRSQGYVVGLKGGPRRRLLPQLYLADPCNLSKYPFFLWGRTTYRDNCHFAPPGHKHAPSGAMLHFKMLSDFSEQVDRAIARGEHWRGASQYHYYRDGIRDGSLLSPLYEGSGRYDGPESLVEAGLMDEIDWSGKVTSRSGQARSLVGRSVSFVMKPFGDGFGPG